MVHCYYSHYLQIVSVDHTFSTVDVFTEIIVCTIQIQLLIVGFNVCLLCNLKASSRAALGPQACALPLLQHDHFGSTVAANPSTGPQPCFQQTSAVTAAAFRALSSPLSVTQGHRFLPSLPAQHLAFPTQDAASYQPGNRKTRTL